VGYRLVIFDFDGTLADSFPWFLSVVNEVADRFGLNRLEGDDVERLRGAGSREILAHFGAPTWKLPRIAAHMRRLAGNDAAAIPLFDGVDALLRRLSEKGIALAIVSSNSEANVRRMLGPENAARIAYYECGASLFDKPAKYKKVLARSGIAREHVICIGDEVRDVEAAHGQRLAFGAVAWGYARAEAFAQHAPAMVFASLDEVVEKVAGEPQVARRSPGTPEVERG
jgi:phosphoglycolate phosphatase